MEQCSGYSAAWSSAFDWGSKGPEFKSPYPDHFFLQKNGQRRRKSSLHAATAALHSKTKFFFASSPYSRRLACEVVSFR